MAIVWATLWATGAQCYNRDDYMRKLGGKKGVSSEVLLQDRTAAIIKYTYEEIVKIGYLNSTPELWQMIGDIIREFTREYIFVADKKYARIGRHEISKLKWWLKKPGGTGKEASDPHLHSDMSTLLVVAGCTDEEGGEMKGTYLEPEKFVKHYVKEIDCPFLGNEGTFTGERRRSHKYINFNFHYRLKVLVGRREIRGHFEDPSDQELADLNDRNANAEDTDAAGLTYCKNTDILVVKIMTTRLMKFSDEFDSIYKGHPREIKSRTTRMEETDDLGITAIKEKITVYPKAVGLNPHGLTENILPRVKLLVARNAEDEFYLLKCYRHDTEESLYTQMHPHILPGMLK
jgi:hypothetical protein